MIKYIFSFIIVKLMAKVNIAITLALITLIILPASALTSTDFNVKIVTFVHDYNKYVTRWNNVFKQGETLKLYLGVENLNKNIGAVAIDFVIFVKDPNNYVVYKKVVKVRKLGYIDHVYTVVDIPIGKNWLDGKYTIEAYAFDVLNYTAVLKSYTRYNIFSAKGGGEIKTINRKNAPYVKKEITFYVNSNADTTPPNRFVIFDSQFGSRVLPVNVPNKLEVSVLNNFDKDGEIKIGLKVDGIIKEVKVVDLKGYEVKRVGFTVPPLSKGTHKIEIVAFSNHVKFADTPPIFIKPLLYDKPILLGKVYDGCIIYTPNNYVLGSVGISEINNVDAKSAVSVFNESGYIMNRESAERVFTNIFAYAYVNYIKTGTITVALLKGSDERAEIVLPNLLEYVKKKTKAPVVYLGVRDYYHLSDVKVLIYVGNGVPRLNMLDSFFKNGGVLVIDNTGYWNDLASSIDAQACFMKNWSGLHYSDELYKSYYDFNVNKVVTITIRKHIPPRFVYSDLNIDKFITDVGSPVTISFKVKNIGGTGREKVEVKVNNRVVFSREIELKKGEEKTISFKYTPMSEGSYKVQIVGTDLIKIFFAKGKTEVSAERVIPTPTPVKEKKKGAGLVVGSAALLAVLVIIRMLMRE